MINCPLHFQLTGRVENIQIAKLFSFATAHAAGSKFHMAGWGRLQNGINPNYMQKAPVKVLSTEECKKKVDKFLPLGFYNWETIICSKTDTPSGYAILSRVRIGLDSQSISDISPAISRIAISKLYCFCRKILEVLSMMNNVA